MSKRKIPPVNEIEGFLYLLQHERLRLLEAIIISSETGYNLTDLEKLALHGSAIQSVKDAIEFRKKIDGA